MSKLITSVLWSVEQSLDKNSKERAQGNIGVSSLCTTQDSDNKYVKRIERDAQGNITSVTGSALDNYNDNSSTPITGKGVKEALSTVTVKVDDSTTALKYLKVTSKPSDSIYGSNFNSGLKSESPSGHSNYSYLSVNCGNGLRIVDSGADIGKLAMKSATDNEIGGIMTGYQPAANTKDYAVQLDSNGRAHVEVPWSYTLSKATDQALGGIMTGYQPAANTKDYAVQLDSNGRAHVEVPWSFTLSKATDQALGGIMTGYQPAANTKDYAVQLDSNGRAHVEVPWSFTLSKATDQALGGIMTGYQPAANTKDYAVQLDSNGRAHVAVPWTDTDNDTKNTVGVGTATSSANAVYKFPFVKGTSTEDYQRSYTALGSYNMLSVEETTDAASYLLKFYGGLVPKVNSNVPDGSLMVYSELHGELIKTSSCGDGLRPIYIGSDGAPKMCQKLYDGGSSGNLSHDTSNNSLYIDDTHIVDPTNPNEYVRFIGSYNFGINNKFIKGHAASGNDPAVDDRWVQDKVGSFLFGDGLSTTRTTHQRQSNNPPIDKYWGAVFNKNPNTTNGLDPVIVEAPSILYAMTTLNDNSHQNYDYEVYNRRRITNYKVCDYMRAVSTSSSYVSAIEFGGRDNLCTGIAYVPPRHWAFVSGCLEEYDNSITRAPTNQVAYFHITETVGSNTNYTADDALCVFDWVQGHEGNEAVSIKHPFSFFAFNPLYDKGQYIQVTINHAASGTGTSNYYTYKIRKQIMIFKEPDYCGGIEDEGGTGGAAQLYDAVYDNYPNNWVLPHLSST